jgi:serine/threonine-protein kinase HipA
MQTWNREKEVRRKNKAMEMLVYADWFELKGAMRMGTLSVEHVKGREVFSFTYDRDWLGRGQAQTLDPDLQLFSGPQYPAPDKKNFGIFLDSSPDRWGHLIMKRREAIAARLEKRKEKTYLQEDYLLGVFDQQRMGALRFKLSEDGPFLNDNADFPAPPWTSLHELEFASMQLENETLSDKESLKWLDMLLAPGASLGGARPKAGVTDEKGALWIAKFPGAGDRTDIGAWEMVTNEMAKDAGIDVATGQAKRFNDKRHTYLSKRFDRIGTKRRVHFASAMTLLGQRDGAENASYLDLAAFIIKNGADPKQDLEELWRRIVFNIAVKNTDDHLRNHGFLLTTSGWSLAPAYDVNPNYQGRGLTLNISDTDNALDFGLAISIAKYFRVEKNADSILKRVRRSVAKWKIVAKKYAIPASEIGVMTTAFEE